MRNYLAAAILVLTLSACGKFGPPVPPEDVSPESVKSLEASANVDGVSFRWEAPDRDQRGKELKQIDGYQVMRKRIEKDSDVADPRVEFELLASTPDTHLQILTELREQAEREGKITRKVRVDPTLRRFQYFDPTPEPGQTYIYKVVPINQGSVEGAARSRVRVRFKGDASSVTVFDEDAESPALDTELEPGEPIG